MRWETFQLQAMTRGGPRTEQVWMNYQPAAVHSARYAGKNFTDRQRVKRKAERWARNFASMPPGEQTAILSAMLLGVASAEQNGDPLQ